MKSGGKAPEKGQRGASKDCSEQCEQTCSGKGKSAGLTGKPRVVSSVRAAPGGHG